MGLDQAAPRPLRRPDEAGDKAAREEDCIPAHQGRTGLELCCQREGGARGLRAELSRNNADRCGGLYRGDFEATGQEVSILVQEGAGEREGSREKEGNGQETPEVHTGRTCPGAAGKAGGGGRAAETGTELRRAEVEVQHDRAAGQGGAAGGEGAAQRRRGQGSERNRLPPRPAEPRQGKEQRVTAPSPAGKPQVNDGLYNC